MATLHEMFPELVAKIVSEQEELKKIKQQRDDVRFGEITRKDGESFADAYFRTNDKSNELHRQILALERRQQFLNLDMIFENPVLDVEKKVISAQNHKMGCSCHMQRVMEQRQVLIDLHEATGLRFEITGTPVGCGVIFPINGILSYQNPKAQMDGKWWMEGYHIYKR